MSFCSVNDDQEESARCGVLWYVMAGGQDKM